MDNERVNEIRAALDEMDRLASVHIAMQGDKDAQIKDVWEAETLRNRHEAYVEREARATWLHELLAERDRLQAVVDAAQALVALDTFHMYDLRTMAAYDELKAKLAAYEQGVSGDS